MNSFTKTVNKDGNNKLPCFKRTKMFMLLNMKLQFDICTVHSWTLTY